MNEPLPRELWMMILKIKWWNARKERILKILKFPEFCSVNKRYGRVFGLDFYHEWQIFDFTRYNGNCFKEHKLCRTVARVYGNYFYSENYKHLFRAGELIYPS